ncbi:hypothetical protein KIV56_11715 [Cryobacterium breve]|uniref:Uncharacterized protein n=1 Tax=Cryobacterium breve TaxID=1259258 RepID=A0ABY7NAY2_9MICO|nr:hypothetical protein [Cryobacterium breve]WBM79152.1 hypothetical protein KIV56_11715 [Cryobacterium breve]
MTSPSARRRHVFAALAAVAAVAAATLSGCAGGTGTAPGTASAVTLSAAAPTATPTATPIVSTGVEDPAIDTQDPSSWLITFDGVGPLEYGGSISAARPSMTYYADATVAACPTVADFQADGTASLRAPLDGDTITALSVTGHTAAASPALAVGSPRTTAGVTVGSTAAELLAAYPGIVQYPAKYPGTDTVYSVSDGGSVWIVFTLMEGVVVHIDLTNSSSALDELCG